MLANGMGGIEWAGLPFVAALLGVRDVDLFTVRLMTIKHFKPPKKESEHG